MAVIPLDGVPLQHIPIVRTATKKALTDQIRAGRYRDVPPSVRQPYPQNINEAYSTFGGRCWILAQTAFLTDHLGNSLRNVRHVFTIDPHQPWWSLPVRPGERAYEFDHHTGAPAPGSGRPYPHPLLPPEIAAIEAERCGPYRDAFGLCTGCGLRGRVQRRCTADDPDRASESRRAPYAQPWKWVPCPHACGHVDQPEVRPSVLYGLVPQLSITR